MDPARSTTRRGLLAGIGAAATAATAGCVEVLPPLGSRVTVGRVDVPAADPPTYRRWIPASSAVPGTAGVNPDNVIAARRTAPGTDNGWAITAFARQVMTGRIDWFGYGYDHYDRAVMVDDGVVLTGEVDPAVVADALDGTGYTAAGEYEGYALYARDDMPRTVAVRDGTVVWASSVGEGDTGAVVRAIADAGAGRIEREHEANDDYAALTAATGERAANWVGPVGYDPTDEALGGAVASVADDRGTYVVSHTLYPEGVAVPVGRIERALRGDRRAVESARAEVTAEDRFAVVEEWFPASATTGRDPVTFPQVTWGASHGDATVTVRHEAGESVDADKLEVERSAGGESSVADASFPGGTVEPGDSLTVPVDDATERVWLTYRPTADRSARLFTYTLP
ncbi:hypothetical protein [Halosegnis marinus]|uniref:Tat (Twin-arginine translocation) pathway signal sequence n=1 Tax=Halosegnis marinus TaxID=3034023 RepID=A0ABD5ZRX3_9EURY|nr:hypothetical protein [Halosegnis sp. DT85]